jgi:hypothetical protein
MDESCRDANIFRLTDAEKEGVRDALVDMCYEPTGGAKLHSEDSYDCISDVFGAFN